MSTVSAAHFPMDDRDLDDAELWAVIDSAAAARSRRIPLAIKNSCQSSNTSQEERWTHSRPQKMARFVEPASCRDNNRMVVIRHPARKTPLVSSPSYASPVPGRFSAKGVSPIIESPKTDCLFVGDKENNTHCLSGSFPSVSMFKQYQSAATAILEKGDFTVISGNTYIKKSGWRKISFFFNLSFEIRDKAIDYDDKRNVIHAEFVVRAYMQGGRFSDGWGSCELREKRFNKPNHDIPSTAETRAKNRACQDLLGIGLYRHDVKDVRTTTLKV